MIPTLQICSTCRATSTEQGSSLPAEIIARTVRRQFEPDQLDIGFYACLGGCSHRPRISLAAADKWSWLFGDINLSDDLDALNQFITFWLECDDGLVEKASRPAQLRPKTLGRLPRLVTASISKPTE